VEDALRQSEERFHSIFANAAIGIVLEDTQGRIIDANPAIQRLLGWNLDELRILGVPGITHPDDSAPSLKLLSEIESGSAGQSIEKRYVCRNSAVIYGSVTLFGIRDSHGNLRYVVAMIEDVTRRKLAEDEIRRQNESLEQQVEDRTGRIRRLEQQRLESEKQVAIGRMAARLAHEINNPLAGVGMSFRLVKPGIPADHPHFRYVDRIEKELERIARIVRQMFELYRPERQEPDIINPAEAIRDVIALLEGNFRACQVTMDLDVAGAERLVVMHEDSLKQVLFNLLQNAIEASPESGHIRLTAAVEDDRLHLSVIDQGPGIPAEAQPHIFEPFFTTKGLLATGGLGLGLSITRSLVESSGGTIEYLTDPSGGTTFTVTLPVQSENSR
jgi:PAS domain S-box-containing protein